jgi:hypothetical protein
MKGVNFLVLIIFLIFATYTNADEPVSVTGLSAEYLDSYYEGVAKVVEAGAKINYMSINKNNGAKDMTIFLYTNSLDPIVSLINMPKSDKSIEFYKKGAVQAAQLFSTGTYKICMSPKTSIDREDVKKSIDMKFGGPFDSKYLNVLVVGALDAFSETYPCK